MALPLDFQFSQGSLQDYVDCPRRFQLRYVQGVTWPAVEAEPSLERERRLWRGAAFHRLVHQHLLGIPVERLWGTVTDDDLRRWWHHYLQSGIGGLPATRYPEVVLSAPVGGYRLMARYDLVAVEPGQRAVIVEWKTSRRRPRREWLAGRLQTRVYPYLLVRAGMDWGGGQPFQPEQVEMVYWFANFPADAERFAYDAERYRADEEHLHALIAEIEALGDADFPLTSQETLCRYCPYRSLCRRGVEAGPLDRLEDEAEPEDGLDLLFDFEQVGETGY